MLNISFYGIYFQNGLLPLYKHSKPNKQHKEHQCLFFQYLYQLLEDNPNIHYVIGGNHFRGTSDYDDVLSCEYYSPILDQWTPIAAMLRGQSDVGVAVFENKIYVVGGYSWNNRCMVEIVQKYDPDKDEWHKVFDLPESLGGIRACTLTVFPPEETTPSPSRESPLSAP